MLRRGFLQSIAAAIGAVSLPLTAGLTATAQAETVTVINAGGRFKFVGPVFFDYGHQIGVSLTLPDGRRIAARAVVERADGAWDRPETERRLKVALLDQAERMIRKAA